MMPNSFSMNWTMNDGHRTSKAPFIASSPVLERLVCSYAYLTTVVHHNRIVRLDEHWRDWMESIGLRGWHIEATEGFQGVYTCSISGGTVSSISREQYGNVVAERYARGSRSVGRVRFHFGHEIRFDRRPANEFRPSER